MSKNKGKNYINSKLLALFLVTSTCLTPAASAVARTKGEEQQNQMVQSLDNEENSNAEEELQVQDSKQKRRYSQSKRARYGILGVASTMLACFSGSKLLNWLKPPSKSVPYGAGRK
jgi:hypothetical protein